MATNTSDFFTFSKTAGTAKNLQKPTDGGDNNLWGGYINVDLDTIVGAVNATSDLIADANQNELVDFTATGSAVNHVGITNAATGNGPTIEAKGDDTNIDLNVSGKGTGKLATTSPKITTGINDSNNNELIKVTATGSAVNEITVANAATGNGPTLSATGDDTNIDLNIAGKGTGEIEIASNIAFSNDTDAKVKLPSAGGIYESDGSTEILTESGGAVSLKNVDIASSVTGFTGIKTVDLWYLNTDITGSQNPIEAQYYTRGSSATGGANLGTGMTLNGSGSDDGIFTFPSTGIWRVESLLGFQLNSDSRYVFNEIHVSTTGTSGTYGTVALGKSNISQGSTTGSSVTHQQAYATCVLDVTTSGTSGTAIKFVVSVASSVTLNRTHTYLQSFVLFTRLGDT